MSLNETARDMLVRAVNAKVSDIFISAGSPPMFKNGSEIYAAAEGIMTPADTEVLIKEFFSFSQTNEYDYLFSSGDCDFSFSLSGIGRFRINAFRQRNSMSAVIRVVQFDLADSSELEIPEAVLNLYKKSHGLILVTGPAGSGKSTLLACLIDLINTRLNKHILTVEDPIEYLHSHKASVVNQREIGSDCQSYAKALHAALRQSPDVILLGEMNDPETISIALNAAESGRLVLSSLHTVGAAKTVERIIDVFPPSQQQQIRVQLSTTLQAVVSRQLLSSPTRGRKPVYEVMLANGTIRSLIREAKSSQIDAAIHAGMTDGMQTMDYSIAKAYKAGEITRDEALAFCVSPDTLMKFF